MYVDGKCAAGIKNQRTVGFGYSKGIEELVKNRRFYRQLYYWILLRAAVANCKNRLDNR
jgi:hypothetical protein